MAITAPYHPKALDSQHRKAMIRCPSCETELPDETSICPTCTRSLEAVEPATLVETHEQKLERQQALQSARAATRTRARGAASIDEARFIPGDIILNRYRVRGLLGRGGMGEVYRADDLKLYQAVALKFLPDSLARDGAALARFHREARVARQISHPNVCRVFDIGEVDGQHFLSMEYIDGEDLSTLLRRIGRLPHDKAVEIARQLCAGLAAAHDTGVLHRDLKPANIMIDGKGRTRITDFGLAGIAEEIPGEELRAGTPAFMAPEQISGGKVSVKSDIYSLGLVLYELFTGRRAFDGPTLDSILDAQVNKTPSTPSSHVKDLDPLVEKVIMRCVEKDPRKRPSTVLDVAAALPGGDPLAAALAAGETPSPEMVAAAHIEGTLAPAIALPLLAAVVIGLALVVFLSGKVMLHRLVPLSKPPEVLEDHARSIISKLGYGDRLPDSAWGFMRADDYLDYIRRTDPSLSRWRKLETGQPAAYVYWFRGSPHRLAPANYWNVSRYDPAFNEPGMTSVQLDTLGRLVAFSAIPPDIEPNLAPGVEPNYADLFSAADLDISKFAQAPPRRTPPVFADTQAAWDGVYPEQPDIPLHIEAAFLRGKAVYFEMLGPWTTIGQNAATPTQTLPRTLFFAFIIVVIVGSAAVARKNLRMGRGDRKGAFRLSIVVFSIYLAAWFFHSNVFPRTFSTNLLQPVEYVRPLSQALFSATLMWLQYLALEPFLRQRWPRKIISWTRLLGGSLRDPLVGRDILVGSFCGVMLLIFRYLNAASPAWFGHPINQLMTPYNLTLRNVLGDVFDRQYGAITLALYMTFMLLLLFMITRKEWAAILILGIILFVTIFGSRVDTWLETVWSAAQVALMLFVLWRYGVLALVASLLFLISFVYPYAGDLNAWYAMGPVIALLFTGGLAAYGCYTSLGGQPLLNFSGQNSGLQSRASS